MVPVNASLHWLPPQGDFNTDLATLKATSDGLKFWTLARELASRNLEFVQTNRLDRVFEQRLAAGLVGELGLETRRLAVLASSTTGHLLSALRVAALRRGLVLSLYEGAYGQYFQEVADPNSRLHAFVPAEILFCLDWETAVRGLQPSSSAEEVDVAKAEILRHIQDVWRLARASFNCPIIQQTIMPLAYDLMGSNEHALPGSRQRFVARLNEDIREAAAIQRVDLLAIDAQCTRLGVDTWHDPVAWLKAKHEIRGAMAPLYGDLVVRLITARLGRSSKCLVLDLDNTLWGGVIGDDGLNNIVLGNGSAHGESFVAFQQYAKDLGSRGIILAVCSKNDEDNALLPFEKHPEMVLRRNDIAAFVSNWNDKATNIRQIASMLNIGLDSMVFVDDNPFERELVRAELPVVAVPEIPAEPALVGRCLSDAGYFESLAFTKDDQQRSAQYQSNLVRSSGLAQATDLASYLRSLDMVLTWSPFNETSTSRVSQLINKTNQFNLTTRRYSEVEVINFMKCTKMLTLQLRLRDRFGDNGIISVLIGKASAPGEILIDTWLMSCRVLGRQVEEAALNILVAEARKMGASKLRGEFKSTSKNDMVRDLYERLGFVRDEISDVGSDGECSQWLLDLAGWSPFEVSIKSNEEYLN